MVTKKNFIVNIVKNIVTLVVIFSKFESKF